MGIRKERKYILIRHPAAGSCDKLLVNHIRNPLYPLIAFMPQLNLLHVFRPPNFFYIVSKEYQQNQNVKMLQ